MTTNIYLARLLASERQQEIATHAEGRRRLLAALPARPSWRVRLAHLFSHDDHLGPRAKLVTGP